MTSNPALLQVPSLDRRALIKGVAAAGLAASFSRYSAAAAPILPKSDEWAVDVTVLEACSCRVFCQCFFTGISMGAEDNHQAPMHPCFFNQAYHVDAGHYGGLELAGAKFWYSGNAGVNLNEHVWPWAIMTFDSRMSESQRQALTRILQTLRFYRDEHWHSHGFGPPAPMEWAAGKDVARASLDSGKLAEMSLKAFKDASDEPVRMLNMGYFGWPRNGGFALMPADVEAYRAPSRAFEFKGTNGLKTTLSMNSRDVNPNTGRVT